MATSAIALFGVLSAKGKNEPLPPNVAYGRDGEFTTDASEVMDGANSKIIQQAENRMHAQNALLVSLLNPNYV